MYTDLNVDFWFLIVSLYMFFDMLLVLENRFQFI